MRYAIRSALNLRSQLRLALLGTAFAFPGGGATLMLPWFLGLRVTMAVRRRRLSWERTALNVPFAVFLLLAFVAGVRSPLPSIALGSWALSLLGFLVVFHSACTVLRESPGFGSSLHRALALGTLAVAVYGLLVLANQHPMRAQLPALGGNAFGFGLMTGILMTLPLFSASSPWPAVAALTLVCGTVAMVATLSRAALYGLLAGGMVYAWLALRGASRRTLVIAAPTLFAGLLLALTMPLVLQTMDSWLIRFSSFHGPARVGAVWRAALAFVISREGYTDRLQVWQVALAMIREHPWLGVGLGVFPFLVNRPGVPPGTPPHSIYLNMGVEVGIPGAIAFLAIFVIALIHGVRHRSVYRNGATAAMVAMMTAEVRDNILIGFHMALGFLVILALLVTSTEYDDLPDPRGLNCPWTINAPAR